METSSAPAATAPAGAVLLSVGVVVAVVAVWGALAARSPELTYHFAPMVAALGGPWAVQYRFGRQSLPASIRLALTGTLIVLAAAAFFRSAGWLEGPTFWSDSGAFGEAVLFAVLGAAIGFAAVSERAAHRSEPVS